MKIRCNGVLLFAVGVIVALACIGCSNSRVSSSDQEQQRDTEQSLGEAHKQVGMPDITNWTERKLARDILELRDKEITTYAYIVNMHGDLIFLGESIGFGLPYSVQFTNPKKLAWFKSTTGRIGGQHEIVPQADPNGLFMPEGLSATWIMLKGDDGSIHPVYVEPEIIVSPFKLHVEKIDS